ncbi:MAG: STAS domain-containing protein [Panacagrimonas sp.]
MSIELRQQDGELIARLQGDFDVDRSPAIRKALLKAIAADQTLLIDLQAVTRIDSSAVASLIEVQQAAARKNVEMRLGGVNEPIMRVLRMCRGEEIFRIQADASA